jgi:nucleotide-binding universal stress UspA family protein
MAANHDFLVVVGVDGSDDARSAAELALREAVAHGGRLVVVHAWGMPPLAAGPEVLNAEVFEEVESSAQEVLAAELAHLRGLALDAPVDGHLAYGSAIPVLLDASTGASLVVVGSRGAGRVMGLILGSVSQAVVGRAGCPVLVVPPAAGKA